LHLVGAPQHDAPVARALSDVAQLQLQFVDEGVLARAANRHDEIEQPRPGAEVDVLQEPSFAAVAEEPPARPDAALDAERARLVDFLVQVVQVVQLDDVVQFDHVVRREGVVHVRRIVGVVGAGVLRGRKKDGAREQRDVAVDGMPDHRRYRRSMSLPWISVWQRMQLS